MIIENVNKKQTKEEQLQLSTTKRLALQGAKLYTQSELDLAVAEAVQRESDLYHRYFHNYSGVPCDGTLAICRWGAAANEALEKARGK